MDVRAPAGAGAGFASLPYGIIQLIVQSLQEPKDQGRAACVSRACRAAVEELAPALFHFTVRNEPMKVLELLRKPYVRSALDVRHTSRSYSALHAAVIYRHAEILSVLLAAGASAEQLDSDGLSPIQYSTRTNYVPQILGRLLSGGADVDFPNARQQTSLMVAAFRGTGLAVDALLAAGSNPTLTDCDGCTALFWASAGGHAAVLERLLIGGADINTTNNEGLSALGIAGEYGHMAALESLLANGASVAGRGGYRALVAAYDKHDMTLIAALRGAGATVCMEDVEGWPVLIPAAATGDLSEVEKLLAAGADVDAAAHSSKTALMFAAELGHADVVCRLLEEKPDVNLSSNRNLSALEYAAYNNHVGIVYSLIAAGGRASRGNIHNMIAEEKHDTEAFDRLLLAGAANGSGGHVLLWASQYGRLEAVKGLLSLGVDADVLPEDDDESEESFGFEDEKLGTTALMLATRHSHVDVVDVLLAAGAAVHLQDEGGTTALDLAVGRQNPKLLQKLLAAVAANSAECGGLLVSACRAGSLKLVEALLAAGVTVHAEEDVEEEDKGMTALMLAAARTSIKSTDACTFVGRELLYQDPHSGSQVHHVKLSLDRGVSWEAATACKREMEDRLEEAEPGRRHLSGFYTQRGYTTMLNGQRQGYIVLATETIDADRQQRFVTFRIQRPNMEPTKPMTKVEMDHQGYARIADAEAEPIWKLWYQYCHAGCLHGDTCATRRRGNVCHIGNRLSVMHLICGAGLPVWMRLQEWHNKSKWGGRYSDGKARPLRIIKYIPTEGGAGQPIVGLEASCAEQVENFRARLSLLWAHIPEKEEEAAAAATQG